MDSTIKDLNYSLEEHALGLLSIILKKGVHCLTTDVPSSDLGGSDHPYLSRYCGLERTYRLWSPLGVAGLLYK